MSSTTTARALFSPIKVGARQLKHRVVLAPMTRQRASPEAVPTDLQVEYYKQRSTKGGLLITEATLIDRLAGGFPRAPGIYNKEQINKWRKVTDAVHEKKGYIFAQLWHLGRVGSKHLNPNQEQVVGPSSIPCPGKNPLGIDYEVPHALNIDEIKEIAQQFARAAQYAMEAGFDGAEIHGANGYLIDQFINSNSNGRTDEYGGSIANRSRFALEIVDLVSKTIGPERTGIRFSPGGVYQDMKDENPTATWSHLVEQLQKNHPDLAYLHFMGKPVTVNSNGEQQDFLEPFRKIWKGPFISSSTYSDKIEIGEKVAEHTGDLIAYGRAFLANPDLPERLRNGFELNEPDTKTIYNHEATGYTDYPFYNNKANN